MSSAKKGKKTPDMKGQHTLFSAIANAKKNESAYKLFSVHPTPKEIECDSHDSQVHRTSCFTVFTNKQIFSYDLPTALPSSPLSHSLSFPPILDPTTGPL